MWTFIQPIHWYYAIISMPLWHFGGQKWWIKGKNWTANVLIVIQFILNAMCCVCLYILRKIRKNIKWNCVGFFASASLIHSKSIAQIHNAICSGVMGKSKSKMKFITERNKENNKPIAVSITKQCLMFLFKQIE